MPSAVAQHPQRIVTMDSWRALRIGLLGGSFDPIHDGHIALAKHAIHTLHLTALIFVPVGKPPHRDTLTASHHLRMMMIRQAITDHGLEDAQACPLDAPREDGAPNYTVDLLETLRARFPTASLSWIMGADAFSAFHTWHDWQRIPTLCHLIVATRGTDDEKKLDPDFFAPPLKTLWQTHAHDLETILTEKAGILRTLPFPSLPFASSTIRQTLKTTPCPSSPESERIWYVGLGLSASVYKTIQQFHLYPLKT